MRTLPRPVPTFRLAALILLTVSGQTFASDTEPRETSNASPDASAAEDGLESPLFLGAAGFSIDLAFTDALANTDPGDQPARASGSAPPFMNPVAKPSILLAASGSALPVIIETRPVNSSSGPVTLEVDITSDACSDRCRAHADWHEPVVDAESGRITLELEARPDRRPRARMRGRHDMYRRLAWIFADHSSRMRTYTIWITATDDTGKQSLASVEVRVAG